ncbi:MAG: CDP-glucose 4,6-dehydratase [Victivallales bacterium]|nr:CDP-glucose 4,6-dehydratase [Victivallales bacterium]
MFDNIYSGRRVLITGHTGFKGSWLALWLRELGAEVCGVGLPPDGEHNHWLLLQLPLRSEVADICDLAALRRIWMDFQPEMVFHLAAQPLVRLSYREPVATFQTNVIGTVNVLEACRQTPSVRAIVAISSDKCYENREWVWGYRENDPMGGYDPYSASKGCSELAVAAYRRSFFLPAAYGGDHRVLLASGRAGNVIGGGDWAPDRLVPDLMKAAAAGSEAVIRAPGATRPWQHVLEPLSGYLALGQQLLRGERGFAGGWNFGPAADGVVTVGDAVAGLARHWDAIRPRFRPSTDGPHEAGLLRLDCAKARYELHWHGVWTAEETFARTAQWYKHFYRDHQLDTAADLAAYIAAARKQELAWTR